MPKRLFQSVFVSYGAPDEGFAARLNESLKRSGVQTFFFREDAKPGARLHHVMRDGVNAHERVILVCSRASLTRRGVLNEIEESLQREAREGGASILVPITLDDFVFKEWTPDRTGLAEALREHVVVDFRGTSDNPPKFNRAVARLVNALEKEQADGTGGSRPEQPMDKRAQLHAAEWLADLHRSESGMLVTIVTGDLYGAERDHTTLTFGEVLHTVKTSEGALNVSDAEKKVVGRLQNNTPLSYGHFVSSMELCYGRRPVRLQSHKVSEGEIRNGKLFAWIFARVISTPKIKPRRWKASRKTRPSKKRGKP